MVDDNKQWLAKGESVSKKPKNGVTAWVVAVLALLATILIYMCSKKLNPAMASVVEFFGQDTAWGGGLGSIYSVVSAVLLLPLSLIHILLPSYSDGATLRRRHFF